MNYKIPIALDTGKMYITTQSGFLKKIQFWNFVKDKFSIMNNKKNIAGRWIDRETHQKAFEFLSETEGGVEHLEQSVSQQLKNITNASVFGYYHEKRNAKDVLIVPEIEIHKSLIVPSFPEKENQKIPFLTFQLREKNKTLQEKKHPIFKMEIKIFYENGTLETSPFPASPFLVNLALPENHKKRDLYIYILNPKEKMIYSAPVPKKEKNETENVEIVPKKKKMEQNM